MKAAALFAVLAAILLCGCSVTPQSTLNKNKPEIREYEDESSAAPVIEPVSVEYDYAVPEYGQPLVYGDFVIGDLDFLGKRINEDQILYAYTYWSSYDENDENYRRIDFFPRTSDDRKEVVLEAYGGEEIPYEPYKDKLLLWARMQGDRTYDTNAMHSSSYCDLKYYIPETSAPFGQYYAGIRFYFDERDRVVMAVMFLNLDLVPLAQIDYHDYNMKIEYEDIELPEVEGETLIPRAILYGMGGYSRLYSDIAYPCLTFEEGMVTVNWYDSDGSPAKGEGILTDGLQMPYKMSECGIDFELPAGGDNMATYISYNSYLDAYELHDPYWRENYGCTLLLGRSVQREVEDR